MTCSTSLNDTSETWKPPESALHAGRLDLPQLLEATQPGYCWAEGTHIYCELRPTEALRVAETDAQAQRYLQIIEDYVRSGQLAASIFGVDLFEVQGSVLHFHKRGGLTPQTVIQALQFAYLFTKVLYDVMRPDLEHEWNGFAICMDHGDAVIVQHGRTSSASVISLGCAANAPAKRLLHGGTRAGHADVPGSWKPLLGAGPAEPAWYSINLRDREQFPFSRLLDNRTLEASLRREFLDYRHGRLLGRILGDPTAIEANAMIDEGGYRADQPYRVQAFCMRADLDGFSRLVEDAFRRGEREVERIAKNFLKLMEFADSYERMTPGAIRLPWAGDCATFLIPPITGLGSFRGKDWIEIVERWQSFAMGTPEGTRHAWGSVFPGVSWAVGMSYAENGHCLVAPVKTNGRQYLVAAGVPLAYALKGQDFGRGGDTVVHRSDYSAFYPPVRRRFDKIRDTDYWRTSRISVERVRKAATEAGESKTPSPADHAAKWSSIQLPAPRPHCG